VLPVRGRDLTDLLVLAAAWGGSFLFIRLAVPEFGTFPLITLRVGIATLCLLPLVILRRKWPEMRRHGRALFFGGVVNAALPFTLFAYAAYDLGAGFLAVANAVTPAWGGVIGWLWLKDRLPRSSWAGLALGFGGMLVLVWDKLSFDTDGTGPAVLAVMLAPLCYGIGANFAKRYLTGVDPLVTTCGSLGGATLVLLPLCIAYWPSQPASIQAWGATLLLATVCTSFAYVIFFRLLATVGPTRAVSVTFLVPLFGILWGAVLLGEVLSFQLILGAAIILLGSALVMLGGSGAKAAAAPEVCPPEPVESIEPLDSIDPTDPNGQNRSRPSD